MRIDLRALQLSFLLNSLAFLLFFLLLRLDVPQRRPIDLSLVELREEPRIYEKASPLPAREVQRSLPKESPKVQRREEIHPQESPREQAKTLKQSQMPVPSETKRESPPAEAQGGTETKDVNIAHGVMEGDGRGKGAEHVGRGSSEQVGRSEATVEDYSLVYNRQNFGVIRSIVKGYLEYPAVARLRGWEGRVVVYICLEGRSLCGLYVRESSGYRVLDEAVIRAVQKAHKEFPQAERRVDLLLPVQFSLKEGS